VHAPQAEQDFVRAGYGVDRQGVMYNDFVIVGPPGDPAAVHEAENAPAALVRIAAARAPFVSRGDDSGTHKKELGLWKQANILPGGSWYREAGQGMGKVLQIAGEMDAYTLTDRGTWLAFKDKSPLRLLSEGDPQLFNPYGIIAVNPERYPDINYTGARALIQWITSPQGQTRIGDFRIGDTRLFTPSASAPAVAKKTK
jgi:tungstate transport system substrate-binding protein